MITSIPLILAQLCANCDEISIMAGSPRCPICQSTALQPLSAILNRPEVVTMSDLCRLVFDSKRGAN
jgi:hypothetical protein